VLAATRPCRGRALRQAIEARQLAVRTLIQGWPIMPKHQVLSIDDWHALLAAS
jgi:hypothetical protein